MAQDNTGGSKITIRAVDQNAYGRLDVFFPDGLLKSFVLSEPNLSVGRSPGNAIPLESETISRYHLSFSHDAARHETSVTDLDSQNGTFIDGVRLKGNEPRRIVGGEEILIGELRLIFQEIDESPTKPNLVPDESTVQAQRVEAHLRAELQGPEIAVPPGAHTSARLKLTNTGDKRQRYRVDVDGVPRAWTRIDRPQLELDAGASAEVSINFKPARQPDTHPGEYPITLTVTPIPAEGEARATDRSTDRLTGTEDPLRLSLALRVLPYGGFGMALETRHLRPDGNFRLHLHNQGSAPLPLVLQAAQPEGALAVTLQPAQLTLAPGQRAVVIGQAKPRRSTLLGEASVEQFDVVARAQTPARYTIAVRAHVPVQPTLPRWAAFAAAGVGLALLALILFGLLILLRPAATPTITRFALQAAPAGSAAGNVLAEWQAENAETVAFLNGQTVLLEGVPAVAGSTLLSLPPGNYTLTLRAIRGGASAEQTGQIAVVPTTPTAQITLSPPSPYQHVVQTVILSWNAQNATGVQVEGVAGLSSTPLEASYPASGNVALSIVPRDESYTLTLAMTDAAGGITRQPFSFTTTDPLCEAQPNTPLREAPSATAQVISTIAPNAGEVALLVDAQDISGGWLRVAGRGWGDIAAFTCTGFNPGDLYKELNVPTVPTLSLTPIAPLTSTAAAPTITQPALVPATASPTPVVNPTVPTGGNTGANMGAGLSTNTFGGALIGILTTAPTITPTPPTPFPTAAT